MIILEKLFNFYGNYKNNSLYSLSVILANAYTSLIVFFVNILLIYERGTDVEVEYVFACKLPTRFESTWMFDFAAI